MDQSGHQGDPGDSRARHHEQRPSVGNAQRLQHVDVAHTRSAAGRSRDLYVPGQHGPHEKPGTSIRAKRERRIYNDFSPKVD